ncbi:MAG: 3-deoxy-D-manno-octulosonic acid transferase [Desulfamplus sp.]|nr:3-deoxy-D-manno-octulosonic acid transferase [Desulfamplus sp.]
MKFLYNTIILSAFFLLLPFLPFIYLFSEKRRANMLQRLGFVHLVRKKQFRKKRLWLHALSVGEVKSAVPLVNALKDRYFNDSDYELIITASTRTGFDMARQLFLDSAQNSSKSGNGGMPVQIGYFPFDLTFSVKSICSRIDPELAIIVESDLWPQFLWYMNDKKIPVFLVNARVSESSFNGYMRFRKIKLFASIFSLFEKIMVQTEIDKERFLRIGVSEAKVVAAGNIKFDQPVPKTDIPELDIFEDSCFRYIIAGSTHQGEEEILVSVFKELKDKLKFKDIKLIIAPRDPKRASDIIKMLKTKGILIASKDDSKKNGAESDNLIGQDIIIIDKMGILASLYSICDIAFVGGSLVPCGGHNPLEPALFSKPVIFGNHMEDFKEISETMLSNEAAFMVKNRDELFATISMILNNSELAGKIGQNGGRLVVNGRGAVEKILSIIAD